MMESLTSAVDVAREIYPFIPVRLLMHIRYPVREYIKKAGMPIMIAHSRDDEIIPYHHGEQLFQLAGEPKTWLEMQGSHNEGFLQTGSAYIRAWDKFLEEVLEE